MLRSVAFVFSASNKKVIEFFGSRLVVGKSPCSEGSVQKEKKDTPKDFAGFICRHRAERMALQGGQYMGLHLADTITPTLIDTKIRSAHQLWGPRL